MFEVYITKTSKYLPNEAISNDEMESYLGMINNTASKARRIILRNNGIISRYYALDKNGNPTHNNAELTVKAIQGLYDGNFSSQDVELLSCGTSTPDNILPSHAAMVHGLMKNHAFEINSSSGVCCSGMSALKYGYMSVKTGNTQNAICTGSERVSSLLVAEKYENEIINLKELKEQPILAFKKDFLRWMLSDGAGAFLLQNKPIGKKSLRIEWIKGFSYAHEIEACMYSGGDKLDDGSIKPWSNYASNEWLEKSIFSIKQDVKILDEYILEKGADSMKSVMDTHKIKADDITYFLPHVSSHYFVKGLSDALNKRGINLPSDKWFMNLKNVGNVGSASIYLMLEELMNSEKLQKGDTILLSVPESGRFSYAYAYLTVC